MGTGEKVMTVQMTGDNVNTLSVKILLNAEELNRCIIVIHTIGPVVANLDNIFARVCNKEIIVSI